MNFNYSIFTNLIFGKGTEKQIAAEAAKLGKKAMIVTGGSSTKKSGLLQRTLDSLSAEGIEAIVFDKAIPNPTLSVVMEGAELMNEEYCDYVVALGGGSIIDTAKAICAAVKNEESLQEILYSGKLITEAMPIVAVPTTCGTGSEGDGISVITVEETKDKLVLFGPGLIPKAAVVDPMLMKTMPKAVYASVAFDAFCHLMEAYLATGANFMTDMMAMEGMRLMKDNLVKVYENYDDDDAWEKVTFASTLGGYTLNSVGCIAIHGMEHPESGLRNVTHGKGLAAITPVILKELAPVCPEKISEISRLFGGKDENDCWKVILDFLKKIGLDVTLEELGFDIEDIHWMSENAFKVSSISMATTPKQLTVDDVERLYKEALDFNKR